ncbi:MAG: hypothetical protein SF162_17670 [bacterium]|nr:hypothetical protein [bacterium]
MDDANNRQNIDDFTLPSKATLPRRPRSGSAAETQPSALGVAQSPTPSAPLLLQHFFEGAVDLDKELTARFTGMPLMSVIRVRQFNGKVRSGAALMAAQDGSASLLVEVDAANHSLTFTYTLSGMLAHSFHVGGLSDMDRTHWLEPMRRETGEIAFLWNQSRWENDYVICAAHKHFTNMFAFSTMRMQAAARLTTDVSRKFTDWITTHW